MGDAAGNEVATVALDAIPPPARPISRPPSGSWVRDASSHAAFDGQRFPPGTLLAGRYRVVARLGKGGMGEVYRADDLALGEPVALKFLPEAAVHNVNLLKRFYDEVRIARQVTHPNVCRVYDIGEIDGQPFLSMQYIDGEDLSALLRRIGRLPAPKATEFARKLCAGLAAAHAQGVLHRDLKPANIMIDGRGEVLIADFGLAGLSGDLKGAEVRNGTPAYMAPEQLAGREVSARSDLYALGLVLYEMYSGQPPFEAASTDEMIRLRESSSPRALSSLVEGLDPAVDRALRRCLDPDPRVRPSSALELAAMLPGGNALEAALAAGQTPSPELVAAAGDDAAALRPAVAGAALAGVGLGLAVLLFVLPALECSASFNFDSPPEALEVKARDLTKTVGYDARPADRATGYVYSDAQIKALDQRALGLAGWALMFARRPSLIRFRYRQSPLPLRTLGSHPGAVDWADPPPLVPGMVSMELDLDGRLTRFEAVPAAQGTAPAATQSLDWRPLFAAAGLDEARFQAAEPSWTPPMASDARAAWTGSLAPPASYAIRVEAASFHGKPVFFRVLWPWTKPETTANPSSPWILALALAMLAFGAYMVWSNLKAGRGDNRGAIRLGIFAACVSLLSWVCASHHVSSQSELDVLGQAVEDALFVAFLSWGIYLAVEPWVRRRWPQVLISWSRLLAGKIRDPMVGRDLLFSSLFGVLYCLLLAVFQYLSLRGGSNPAGQFTLDNLMGGRAVAGYFLRHVLWALGGGQTFLLLFFILRVVLRKEWLAAVAFVGILVASKMPGASDPLLTALVFVIVYGIIVVLLLRFGLLAVVLTAFVIDGTMSALFTRDVFAWYGLSSLVALAVVAGMALWGFRLALGRRKLIDDKVLGV